MLRPIDDLDIEDMLHGAFVPDSESAHGTLLGAVGLIDSSVDGDVLLLGNGNGNDFYAVPLSLTRLRRGIERFVEEERRRRHEPVRPASIGQERWDAMDDLGRDLACVAAARPEDVAADEWRRMEPLARTTAAMLDEASALDRDPHVLPAAGFSTADVEAMARIVSALSPEEVERLVRRGYAAEGASAEDVIAGSGIPA